MLSVIVPAYNEQNYIEQAVNSIRNQTYRDIEIILVDDGSTDDTGKIMDNLAKADSRVRVVHKQNGGPVQSRKAGIIIATGEYVTFADGDDWIEPNAYEEMMEKCAEADIVIAGHMENVGDVCNKVLNSAVAGMYDGKQLVENLYPGMLLTQGAFAEWKIFSGLWNKIFRMDLVKKFVLEVDDSVVMGDDAAVIVPAMLAADRVCVMERCYYHYRKKPDTLIGEVPPLELERKRFQALYRCVNEQLVNYQVKYDAREDWLRFMLFLMVPRADQLYEGFQELDFLFPFKGVEKGSKVIIYAAGTYGQRLYKYLKKSKFCEVVLWVDRNYVELQKMGLSVESPEKIRDVEYDYIILPMSFEKSRKAVENYLHTFCPVEKVVSIDTDLVFAKETLSAFGLDA